MKKIYTLAFLILFTPLFNVFSSEFDSTKAANKMARPLKCFYEEGSQLLDVNCSQFSKYSSVSIPNVCVVSNGWKFGDWVPKQSVTNERHAQFVKATKELNVRIRALQNENRSDSKKIDKEKKKKSKDQNKNIINNARNRIKDRNSKIGSHTQHIARIKKSIFIDQKYEEGDFRFVEKFPCSRGVSFGLIESEDDIYGPRLNDTDEVTKSSGLYTSNVTYTSEELATSFPVSCYKNHAESKVSQSSNMPIDCARSPLSSEFCQLVDFQNETKVGSIRLKGQWWVYNSKPGSKPDSVCYGGVKLDYFDSVVTEIFDYDIKDRDYNLDSSREEEIFSCFAARRITTKKRVPRKNKRRGKAKGKKVVTNTISKEIARQCNIARCELKKNGRTCCRQDANGKWWYQKAQKFDESTETISNSKFLPCNFGIRIKRPKG